MAHLPLNLSGILIPTTTPFDPVTGDVDVVGLRSNVRRYMDDPVLGVVVGGSTGEAVLLDRSERARALETMRDVVPEDRLLVAGTGAESTRHTVALTLDAAKSGVDAVLVQPPAFYRGAMSPEVLVRHYRAVADESPVPVILYQVPLRFSTLELEAGMVGELSRHPNIVGIKDSRGDLDRLAAVLEGAHEGFQVLVGSGSTLYPSLELGAVGGILGVANVVPGWTSRLHGAFQAGDQVEAGRLQEVVTPLHNEIVGGLGVPGVKYALDLLGLQGGDPRPPLAPLNEKGRRRVETVLRAASLIE